MYGAWIRACFSPVGTLTLHVPHEQLLLERESGFDGRWLAPGPEWRGFRTSLACRIGEHHSRFNRLLAPNWPRVACVLVQVGEQLVPSRIWLYHECAGQFLVRDPPTAEVRSPCRLWDLDRKSTPNFIRRSGQVPWYRHNMSGKNRVKPTRCLFFFPITPVKEGERSLLQVLKISKISRVTSDVGEARHAR